MLEEAGRRIGRGLGIDMLVKEKNIAGKWDCSKSKYRLYSVYGLCHFAK